MTTKVTDVTDFAGATSVSIVATSDTMFRLHAEQPLKCATRTTTTQSRQSSDCNKNPTTNGCVIAETHVDGAWAPCKGNDVRGVQVFVTQWDGVRSQFPTDDHGNATVVFEGVLRVPPSSQDYGRIRAANLDQAVAFSPAVYAKSIRNWRALDQVGPFVARFGDTEDARALLEWKSQIDAQAAEARGVQEAEARAAALRDLPATIHSDLSRATLNGWCDTCDHDIVQILLEDASAARAAGEQALAQEVDKRVKDIRASRARWLKNPKIPMAAKTVWPLQQSARNAYLSPQFSARFLEQYGASFSLRSYKEVDRLPTPVVVTVRPDEVQVDLAFRPHAAPPNCAQYAERGAAVARFARYACPMLYMNYYVYAGEAFARFLTQNNGRDYVELSHQIRRTVVVAWAENGDALVFRFSGPPSGNRMDAVISVLSSGSEYLLEGGAAYFTRDRLEDLQGNSTGLGAMQRVLDELGVPR